MDKWLFEICNNGRTIVPKFELMEFIGICNANDIVPFIESESYDKYDSDNPYCGIAEGVILVRVNELTPKQGLIIAKYKHKEERYNQLIKKGYDVFTALKVLRI